MGRAGQSKARRIRVAGELLFQLCSSLFWAASLTMTWLDRSG